MDLGFFMLVVVVVFGLLAIAGAKVLLVLACRCLLLSALRAPKSPIKEAPKRGRVSSGD